MKLSNSLAARGLLAVALMVGFYALALGIAGGLLYIPYAEYTYANRMHARLWLGCLVAAGTILWSLVPRPDRFEAPGPQLTAANAPELFTLIHDVARATAQQPPQEVYLLNEMNAWVSHRGGTMGFGSRRVMGVGLPLIRSLSPSELKAVIAHEFGHYVSGDVALGPWIYKTRAAIARTVSNLGESWLVFAFNWYSRLFLKLTMAVSRRQEFIADETAARIAGAAPMARALRKVAALGPAYDNYFHNEVVPVLRSGFLPPITEGFDRFRADPDTMQAFEQYAESRSTGEHAGEFDTHPPLADRIMALGVPLTDPTPIEFEASVPFLAEPEQQARALLEYQGGAERVDGLSAIPWESVAEQVYGTRWTRTADNYRDWFGTMTTDTIPAGGLSYAEMGAALADEGEELDSDEKISRAIDVMTAGLGAALMRQGWRPQTGPGQPLVLVHGEQRVEPRTTIINLVETPGTLDEWKARCQELGIAGLPLADAAAASV